MGNMELRVTRESGLSVWMDTPGRRKRLKNCIPRLSEESVFVDGLRGWLQCGTWSQDHGGREWPKWQLRDLACQAMTRLPVKSGPVFGHFITGIRKASSTPYNQPGRISVPYHSFLWFSSLHREHLCYSTLPLSKPSEELQPHISIMATSDLDQLIDMGFEKEKAALAVKKTGGCKMPSTRNLCLDS